MHWTEYTIKWLRPSAFLLILTSLELQSKARAIQEIQDAAIYPGKYKGKMKLAFSTIGDFSNLWDIVKTEGFLDVGLFCVKRGAFLVYRNLNYDVEEPADILLASGNNNCFKPSSIIGSAQPLGPINQPKQDSITFFHKPYFSSFGKATTVSVGSTFFSSIGAAVKSLIVIGRTGWQITTAAGKTFCVAGKGLIKDELSPICLFPNFAQSVIKKPAIAIVSAKRGCSDASNNISITYCHYWGKAEPLGENDGKSTDLDDSSGLSGRSAFAACDAPAGEGAAAFNETLMLFKAVLSGSFDDALILDWPGFGKERWKLEILDLIFDIAKLAIANELMSDTYINRIRELFLFTLEKAWMNSSSSDAEMNSTGDGTVNEEDLAASDLRLVMLTEYDYRGMIFQTEECLSKLDGTVAGLALSKWTGISDEKDLDSLITEGLHWKRDSNIIIEMTWLITNMVGGLCHKHFQFAHNYWALYIHIVNRLYLQPVVPLWYTKIPNLDVILGGNMELQYKKLAMVTSFSLYASKALDPFRRPNMS